MHLLNVTDLDGFWGDDNPLYNTDIVTPEIMTKRFHWPNDPTTNLRHQLLSLVINDYQRLLVGGFNPFEKY